MRRLSFMLFGISAFAHPLDPLSPVHLAFGAVFGLFFGWLFKRFLYAFVAMMNRPVRKEWGKKVMRHPVETGMLFLIPFAVMMALATFYLKWYQPAAFISAGMMAVGTATAIELGHLRGEILIRNTIVTSGVSFLFSFLWIFSLPFLNRAPGLIDGGITLLHSLLAGGGGLS